MTDGLKARHRTAIIATLAANDRVERAVLFGSRAMGTNTITSDVDIALFGTHLTLTDQARLAAACEELPMAQSVDLLLHSTVDNPALVAHIRTHGVEWYRRGGGRVGATQSNGLYPSADEGKVASSLYHPFFPKHWTHQPLYSMAHWVNGLAFKNIKFTPNGKPIIKISEIKNGISSQTKFTQSEFDESVRIRAGDLLFSWSGQPESSINAFWWRGPEGWLNQHIFRVTPSNEINENFFFYILRYLRPNFIAIARNKQTTGLGHVTKQDLQRIVAAAPPLPEQRAIAHILGTLDDKIELNRRMNKTLEAMARALFKDWFVDFGPVRAKAEGRAAYLPEEIWGLFPDSFEGSELGEIPRGWGVRRLDDYLELAYGKSLPAKSRRPGSVPVYGSGGVVGTHDVALTRGPTVIVGRKGTVGSLYLTAQPVFPIDTVFHTSPRIGSMLFSYHLLTCQPLRTMNTDAAVPGLNRGNVYRLKFPCPTSDFISAFDNMAGCFWKRQVGTLDESSALAQIRDSLIPRLISGKVTIDEVEKVAEAVQ